MLAVIAQLALSPVAAYPTTACNRSDPMTEDDLKSLPDRLRLPISFDSAPLLRDAEALAASDWVAHFVPDHYAGEWSVLPLRAPAGAVHPILQIASNPGTTDWVDTPLLDQSPALKAALGQIPGPILSARLMRLGPGSDIHEHSDAALSPEEGAVRLHVPIATNDDVDFRLNGQRVIMAPGELWYLRLSDPHSVANRGASARVHLVVDCDMSEAMAALLSQGQAPRAATG
jgi:Aspartyl/Asparaginyl beta-hydroxylase